MCCALYWLCQGLAQPQGIPAAPASRAEFCDRGSLSDIVRSNRFRRKPDGEPDMPAILRCLIDVAAGMDYLHGANVVHGDLKSANVLLRSTATDARGFTCKARAACGAGLTFGGSGCQTVGDLVMFMPRRWAWLVRSQAVCLTVWRHSMVSIQTRAPA